MTLHIYAWNLNRIFLIVVSCIFLWGFLNARYQNKPWWRIFNTILAIIATYGILRYTVLGRAPTEHIEAPVRSLQELYRNKELIREMVMNAFLFFPLGLSLPCAISNRKHWFPMIAAIGFAFVLSLSIESIQYLYHLGVGESSDVIMNTLGAFIGASANILSNRVKIVWKRLKNR